MLDKERITIDITSEQIAILVGTRFKIYHSALIETPQGSFENDQIVDIDRLKAAIMPQISNGNVKKKIKDVYFVVRGEELILRQISLPQMKDAALKDSVEWELTQVVGDRADEYYVDYEVLAKKAEGQEQNLEVLMVATEKAKVANYVELGKALGLRVKVIDMCANLTARTMRSYQDVFKNGVKSIGVLDLRAENSGFTIIDKGRLMQHKFRGEGMASISDEKFDSKMDYEVFLNKVDINAEGIDDFTDGETERFLSSLVFHYNSIVQYYSSGKVKKTLDKIYIFGSGTKVHGFKAYIEESFNTQVELMPGFEDLRTSIKYPKKAKMEDFFYAYALMLKQDEKELNLVPQEEENALKKEGQKKSAVAVAIAVVVAMGLGFGGVKGYEVYLGYKEKDLQKELAKSQALIEKQDKLDKEIALVNEHIQIAGKVDTLKSKETDTFLKELNKLMPATVVAASVNYTKDGNIAIAATASDQASAEKFYANLRESKDYSNCHIASLTNADGKVTFTVEITLSKEVVTDEANS
ncbi:MAG: pilus assembly protein PilM [Clostridium sp.]